MTTPGASDQDAIRAIVRQINNYWRDKEYDKIGGHLASEVVIVPPGSGERITGRQAYIQSYRDYDEGSKTLAFHSGDPDVDVVGATAVAVTAFTVVFEINGARHHEQGRDILAFSRETDGWKVAWRTMQVAPIETQSAHPVTPPNEKRMKFTINQRLADHMIQAVLIFASVFLAFWLNEYGIRQEEEERRHTALIAIRSEMQNNLQILERWSPYHQKIAERTEWLLNHHPDSITTFRPNALFERDKGIFRELLTDHAWSYLNQSNIQMEMKTKLKIAQIYQQQQFVQNALNDVFHFLKQRDILREELAYENHILFHSRISEVYAQETAMISNLKRVIGELGDSEDER